MKPITAVLSVVAVLWASTAVRAQLPGGQDQGQIMTGMPAVQGIPPTILGGIPTGARTPGVLPLSIRDTVERGLRYNLGVALGQQDIRAAQSARLRSLSELLPHVTTRTGESVEQVNLASLGFSGFPGIPAVIGPFAVFDTRVALSQPMLNLSRLDELRSSTSQVTAVEHNFKNTRDQIVLVCLNFYMQAVTGESRIDANQAQLKTAQALYDLAVSRQNAGFVPGIEVLRAKVEMQSRQQRLIVAQNDFAKEKLNLAQAIGLPLGQEFQLTDKVPYAPFAITLESAVQDAYRNRGDYQSALELVKAAEESRRAAVRQRMPSLDMNADYGIIGQRPFNSHGDFTVAFSLRIPIFQGKEVESKITAADARLEQQKAMLESLRASIYYEISAAMLDLTSSEQRVQVAGSNLDLANQQVAQARDRFSAGVVSNIEVVQAQDALAGATEDYISSLYAHNIAKAGLAQAMGLTESDYLRFLGNK